MRRVFLGKVFLLILLPFLLSSEVLLEKKSEISEKNILMPIALQVYRGKLFVLDEGVIKVLKDEKYLYNIGNIGQGPGEFTQLIDFKVKDDVVYCLGGGGGKLEKFNLDGKYSDGFKIKIASPFQLEIGDKIYIHHIGVVEYLINAYKWGKGEPERSFLKAKEITNPYDFKQLYQNFGLICWSERERKLYFGYVLDNKLLKIDIKKGDIEEIVLPCKPPSKIEIEKKPGMVLLKNALVYDIKAYNGKVYVLINEKNGKSVIFEITKGEVVKTYRFNVELIKFAYNEEIDEFYGIEKEEFKILKFGRVKKK
ncbi:MAG: 6-bladed beta-propeller [Candidatus Aminicenantia bacterium]